MLVLLDFPVGMTAMMGVGALMGTGFGAFFLGAGIVAAIMIIDSLGATAARQVGRIEGLASILSLLADSLSRIKAIGNIELTINTKDFTEQVKAIKNISVDVTKDFTERVQAMKN